MEKYIDWYNYGLGQTTMYMQYALNVKLMYYGIVKSIILLMTEYLHILYATA